MCKILGIFRKIERYPRPRKGMLILYTTGLVLLPMLTKPGLIYLHTSKRHMNRFHRLRQPLKSMQPIRQLSGLKQLIISQISSFLITQKSKLVPYRGGCRAHIRSDLDPNIISITIIIKKQC